MSMSTPTDTPTPVRLSRLYNSVLSLQRLSGSTQSQHGSPGCQCQSGVGGEQCLGTSARSPGPAVARNQRVSRADYQGDDGGLRVREYQTGRDRRDLERGDGACG